MPTNGKYVGMDQMQNIMVFHIFSGIGVQYPNRDMLLLAQLTIALNPITVKDELSPLTLENLSDPWLTHPDHREKSLWLELGMKIQNCGLQPMVGIYICMSIIPQNEGR